jgi:hypothetical protein
MRKYNGAMAFLEFFSNLIRRVPHFTLLGSRLRGNDLIWKKNCEQSSSWVPACAGMMWVDYLCLTLSGVIIFIA